MEILGKLDDSIVSISPSSLNDDEFISLTQNGSLSLWDTRLGAKCHSTIFMGCEKEYTEALFISDRFEVLTVCDNTVELYDVRKGNSCMKQYSHDVEVVQFISGKHHANTTVTLFVDEDGAVVPLDILSMSPSSIVPAAIFGSEVEIPGSNNRFGGLSNYCCVFEHLEIGTNRFLLTLGMDGEGRLFSSADAAPFLLSYDVEATGQIVNPPLPTCGRIFQNLIAVGRADGTYTVATVDPSSDEHVIEEFSAPGHETSGLCAVEWVGSSEARRLLTVSLSGDITAWDVLSFLNMPEDEETEDGGALPPVSSAYTVRDLFGSKNSVVNCVSKQKEQMILLGDTLGNVISCNLELQ